MKQFTLKFTEENLKRHLDYNKDLIFTIRDEPKGEEGDVTIIEENIYILLSLVETTVKLINDGPRNIIWKVEGFNSKEEYLKEVCRIYACDPNKELFVHVLYLLPSVGE